MKEITILLFNLLCFLNIFSQNDSIPTIDFSIIEKKPFATPQLNVDKNFNYDFKIVDSLLFYKNTHKEDLLTANYQVDFKLHMSNRKSILKFECKEQIAETCYQYNGYSENAEIHVISRCKDVCELYLIDSYNGSTLAVASEFDEGSYPIFLPKHMIIYASYFDDSFAEFYEYRSIISIYKMNNTNELDKKFIYMGSINSKKWSIKEIYQSNTENSFMIKIFDKPNEFDYIEITIQ